jgi:hypothetical protein
VHLEWDRPLLVHPDNPIGGYRIYRSHWDDPFGAPLDEIVDSASLVVYEDPGVPLDSLRYAVTALYSAGESGASNQVLVDEEIWFTPPQSLAASAVGDAVHLEWERPAPVHTSANDLLLYRVYRAEDGQPYGAPLASVEDDADVVSYDDAGVAGGVYDYVVTALYAVRESDPSNEVQVEVEDTSAIGDLFGPGVLGLRVAPNPFGRTTAIHFSPAGTAPLSISIYDVSGARVRHLLETPGARVEERFVIWDGRDGLGHPVTSGTYFVRLQEGDRTVTHRIVRMR